MGEGGEYISNIYFAEILLHIRLILWKLPFIIK